MSDRSHLAYALAALASIEHQRGHHETARNRFHESLAVARPCGDPDQVMEIVGEVAVFEGELANHDLSLTLNGEAIALARDLGDIEWNRMLEHNAACTMGESGRTEDAQRMMLGSMPEVLAKGLPSNLPFPGEDYAAVLADLGEYRTAVGLLASTDAMRERLAIPRQPTQQATLAPRIEKTHASRDHEEWNRCYHFGFETPPRVRSGRNCRDERVS